MMNKGIFGIITLVLLVLALASCGMLADEHVGIYLNIEAPGIQSAEIDFWCGDTLRNTTGFCNADNTEMKPGQVFGVDRPETGTLDLTCDITFTTVDGEEHNSEKTKVTLPSGQEKYDLVVRLDEKGEYQVRILSTAKENQHG